MKNFLHFFLFGCMMLFNACIVGKKVVYVKDMQADISYPVLPAPDLRIQANDRISILVSSRTPELAVPFNQGIGGYQMNDRGDVSGAGAASIDNRGYLVDEHGAIEFPILGTIPVNGKTLSEVKNTIRQRLIDEKLIGDPIVKVELLNLRINMLGEINRVGLLEVPDARITLLQAISQAGGLTTNAATERITVIREEGGQRKMIINNIQSKEIFDSPAYYLQQNDVVYVEAKGAQLSAKEENNWRYLSTGLGLLTTIFTLINIFN